MAEFKDLFSDVSAEYKRIRPDYPQALFAALASKCSNHELALDCAAGSGQAARGLAPFFDQILLSDASHEQLKAAGSGFNCVVATAEQIPLVDRSLDLLMVAQALHWFDHSRFFSEVSRVLKPGGVFAAWCYEVFHSDPAIDELLSTYYHHTLDGYWAPERRFIDEGYRSIHLPFPKLRLPSFQIKKVWAYDELVRYLHTWSATRALIRASGRQPFEQFCESLKVAWGDTTVARRFVWPVSVLAGRNEPVSR